MKLFLVVSFVIFVQCRPEAGYNYRPPFSLPGPPQGGVVSVGHQGSSSLSSNGPNYFQTGSIAHHFGGGSASGGTGFGVSGFGGGEHSSNLNVIDGSTGGVSFSGGNSISSGSFASGGSSNFVSQGPALVQKHIYVHVPPPEPEEASFQRQQVTLAAPQKHYKIIFIKAPSLGPSLAQQQIALSSQSQEKTIVYVLVKKPEDFSDISIPAIAPTQPNKPEVYFIKYKAQKQNVVGGTGQGAVSGGLSGIGTTSFGGGSVISGGGGVSSPSQGLISGTVSSGIGGISSGIGGITSGPVVSSGSASSSIGGIPAPQYGPPGKSGPY